MAREQPEQIPVIKTEPISPESPPKLLPPKHPGNVNHYDFTLASQSRRRLDDDPFEDEQPEPEHERKFPAPKKRPQVLIEGAFGNTLNERRTKRAEDSSTEEDDDEAQENWPPQRAKKGQTKFLKDGSAGKSKDDLERQAAEQRRREKGKGKTVEPDEPAAISLKADKRRDSAGHPPIKPPQPQILDVQDVPEPGPSRTTTSALVIYTCLFHELTCLL